MGVQSNRLRRNPNSNVNQSGVRFGSQQQANVIHQASGVRAVGRNRAQMTGQSRAAAVGPAGNYRFGAVPTAPCPPPNIWQLWGWPPQYICAPPRLAGQRPRPQSGRGMGNRIFDAGSGGFRRSRVIGSTAYQPKAMPAPAQRVFRAPPMRKRKKLDELWYLK